MSHSVSSSSLNRPLIYEDLIYLSLPHKVLRWLGKVNWIYCSHQSSPGYIHVDFAFTVTFCCVGSWQTLSCVYMVVICGAAFGSPLVFDAALTEPQFLRPSNLEDVNNQAKPAQHVVQISRWDQQCRGVVDRSACNHKMWDYYEQMGTSNKLDMEGYN